MTHTPQDIEKITLAVHRNLAANYRGEAARNQLLIDNIWAILMRDIDVHDKHILILRQFLAFYDKKPMTAIEFSQAPTFRERHLAAGSPGPEPLPPGRVYGPHEKEV